MSLPLGLLGLLRYQDSTGYDLAKKFEDSLNSFWHAQSSQIYRELNRMEEKGWVTSKSVIQDNRPNKRVYAITESGREVFNEWTGGCTELFENPHDPFLMRVFFGANAPEKTLQQLKAYRDACLADLEKHTGTLQSNIDAYKPAVPHGEAESLYWQMTLDFGIAKTRAAVQWAEECIKKLEAAVKRE